MKSALRTLPHRRPARQRSGSPCGQKCRSVLTLHQPDPAEPECLLGVCESCKRCYVANPEGIALVRIPQASKVRRRKKDDQFVISRASNVLLAH